MSAAITVTDSFLKSDYDNDLSKDTCKKILKALRILVSNINNTGLHVERLSNGLWSARVDDNYRIILQRSESDTFTALFVSKHDDAYRFAERTTPEPVGIFPKPSEVRESSAAKMRLNDLESLVKTRKYLPIARTLLNEQHRSANFTFVQVQQMIAKQLPSSAKKHRAWWANDRKGPRSVIIMARSRMESRLR